MTDWYAAAMRAHAEVYRLLAERRDLQERMDALGYDDDDEAAFDAALRERDALDIRIDAARANARALDRSSELSGKPRDGRED